MRLLIVILVVGLLFYLMTQKSQSKWIKENKWKLIGGALASGIIVLVITGKLPALAAVAAPFAAFGRRLWGLRNILSMVPQIRRILGFGAAAGAAGSATGNKQRQNDKPMTVKRACEILGVEKNATATEIRAAHRRLMGKMHPDKDGTDYLAALINEARDYLLSHQQDG